MLIVLSDIHGNIESLKNLKLLSEYQDESSEVIFVGDYVDGFNLRKGAVEETLKFIYAEVQSGKAKAIMGNHDFEFVNFISYQHPPYSWFKSMGGDSTMKSMGIQIWQPPELIRSEVRKTLTPELTWWLRDLPFFYQKNNVVFVHAGFQLRDIPSNNHHLNMIWIRDAYYNYKHFTEIHDFYKDKVVVTGHTPNPLILNGIYGPIVRKKAFTQYFIDGASKGSPTNSGQINALILSDTGEYIKSYALKEDGYYEIELTEFPL